MQNGQHFVMTFKEIVADALRDFSRVATLAQANCSTDSVTVEISEKPHESPTILPIGRMAVYAFECSIFNPTILTSDLWASLAAPIPLVGCAR